MVIFSLRILFAVALFAGFSTDAWALFHRTGKDLLVLEDDLKTKLEGDDRVLTAMTPLLLARPKHVWRESRDDFSASVTAMLKRVLGDSSILECQQCDTHRLYVAEDERVIVQNGELGPLDFRQLREQPGFATAKSMALVAETPSGIEMRVISIKDGRILYMALADSTRSLSTTNPYQHYATELERRKMGEALAYTFVNIGLYPEGMFQLEWVEQFGSRNQHVAGVGISLFNPIFAIGGVYHYMLPSHPRANLAGALYYPLQNALGDLGSTGEDSATGGMVLQLMAQYAFTDTFGSFLALNSRGDVSLGVNLFNPLLMPFML